MFFPSKELQLKFNNKYMDIQREFFSHKEQKYIYSIYKSKKIIENAYQDNQSESIYLRTTQSIHLFTDVLATIFPPCALIMASPHSKKKSIKNLFFIRIIDNLQAIMQSLVDSLWCPYKFANSMPPTMSHKSSTFKENAIISSW